LNVGVHLEALFAAANSGSAEERWKYMSVGPFDNQNMLKDWLDFQHSDTSRVTFVIVGEGKQQLLIAIDRLLISFFQSDTSSTRNGKLYAN